MKVSNVVSLEWYGSLDHCIQEDTQAPYVCTKARVALVMNDLRGQISWSATLFVDRVSFLNYPTDSKVAQFDTTLTIHKNIVELDVSMEHASTVAVTKRVKYLLENRLGTLLIQPSSFLDILK